MNSADPADFADAADIKNPPNTKSAEFILTLGENEFRGLRGFQSEILSLEFLTRGKQKCTCSFSSYTALERFQNNLVVDPGGGDSLSDGRGSDIFGFVKLCLVYLWVRYLVHNQYIFGVADEKI